MICIPNTEVFKLIFWCTLVVIILITIAFNLFGFNSPQLAAGLFIASYLALKFHRGSKAACNDRLIVQNGRSVTVVQAINRCV